MLVVLAACGGAPHPSTVKVDGVDVAYEIRGKGPTCVVMPGGPGLSSAYLRSKELEQHVRAVYVDPLGTGASGKLAPPATYSMARDVATLEALRAKLHLAKWCVIGHSYGGFVALRYAIDHPAQVSGLLLYSTSPRIDEEWMKSVGENSSWFKAEPWFAGASRAQQSESEAKTQMDLDNAVAGELPLYFADWTLRQHALVDFARAIHVDFDVSHRRLDEPFDVHEQLATIKVPTVIVSGERDFLFGGKVATWLDVIPNSKRVPIPKAGHFSHVEQPAQFGNAVAALAAELH